jgi:1-acyl-sn-glycerol-3-phosphate acyltransferase
MIYKLLFPVFRHSLYQFFSSVSISGEAPVESGPLLIVCNHQNDLIDSIVVGAAYKRPLWFLAKAALFKRGPVRWLMERAHLIPVHRKQDSDDSRQMLEGNRAMFQAVFNGLSASQAVAIYPEGTCWGERVLNPLKTGAARIALGAEAESDFELGLKIQALGLTYSDMDQFRSTVTLRIGEAFDLASYKEKYEANPKDAVRELTEEIEARIRAVTVEVPSGETERLVEKINKLYQTIGGTEDDYERFNIIAANVVSLAPKFPEQKALIEKRIDNVLLMMNSLSLREGQNINLNLSAFKVSMLLPVILLGSAVFSVPYRCVRHLVQALSKHPSDQGTLKFVLGMLLFPLWVFILSFAFAFFGGGYLGGCLAFIGLSALAYLVNSILPELTLLLFSKVWPVNPNPITVVQKMRDELVEELESLRLTP